MALKAQDSNKALIADCELIANHSTIHNFGTTIADESPWKCQTPLDPRCHSRSGLADAGDARASSKFRVPAPVSRGELALPIYRIWPR